MNRNYNENYNNKYNLDPKWVKCAGCSKPATLRREEGKFIVSAYRGRNNEELCHKCASCYHCGKKEKWDIYRKKVDGQWEVEEDYGMPSYHLVDKENPSGGWNIAFCLDCSDKKGHEIDRYYDDREYWKVDGVMFNPKMKREWNNFENFKRAYEKAQDYWNSLSSSEREQEGERLIENMKLGKYWGGLRGKEGEMFGWVPNQSWWQIKNGKLVSDNPQLVPVLIAEEFVRKMFGDINLCKELVLRDYKIQEKDNKENSPKSNPAAPNSQPITNSNDKNDNLVNRNNSPKPNPGKDNSSETKNNVKTIRFENKENESKDKPANSVENSPDRADNQTLIINLKEIKKITLSEGNLIIEFDNQQAGNRWHSISQTITPDQINNNQELQTVKDYLEKNNQNSLSQQELNKLLSKNNNNSVSPEKPKDNNPLLIGVIVGGTLIISIVIGLLLRRKKGVKKVN